MKALGWRSEGDRPCICIAIAYRLARFQILHQETDVDAVCSTRQLFPIRDHTHREKLSRACMHDHTHRNECPCMHMRNHAEHRKIVCHFGLVRDRAFTVFFFIDALRAASAACDRLELERRLLQGQSRAEN